MNLSTRAGRQRTGTRTIVGALCATALVLAVGACGSSSSSSSSDGKLAPLTVTVASEIPEYSPVYIGLALGIFDKLGLKVTTIDNAGSNGTNYLISGRADLEFYSPTQAILTKTKGQNIKIIYDNENFDGASLLGSAKTTSIQQLQSTKNCVIGSTPEGTNDYYMASQYKALLHLDCQIKIFATVPPMVASVSSGAIQAAAVPYSNALTVVAAKQGNLLVDPSTSDFQSTYIPQKFCAFGEIGLAPNLEKKKASILAFLKGMVQATQYIESNDSATVVAQLQKEPAFKAAPAASLTQALDAAKPFLPTGPTWGEISQSDWTYALSQYDKFGLQGFSSSEDAAQYANIIDTSYVQQALGNS